MKKLFYLLVLVTVFIFQALPSGFSESYDSIQPLLDQVTQSHLNPQSGRVGAVPMLMEADGDWLNIVCELYVSSNPDYDPETDDASDADWIGTGEFVLQKSKDSPYGYTLVSFHQVIDEASDNPLAVYTSEELGFSFAYPVELADHLVETDGGVWASSPNGALSIDAKVEANNSHTLESYGEWLQSQHEGSLLSLYGDAGYLTLAFETEGLTCYRVVSVTHEAIYQAELRFATPMADMYGMFAEYLENSFTIFEYAVG